jgi:hypothetical protein
VRGRLRPGGLRALVADALARRPDLAFTPTQLSNMLGRSAGAIANALVTLCEQGVAVQTQDKPRAYSAVGSGNTREARAARGKAGNSDRGRRTGTRDTTGTATANAASGADRDDRTAAGGGRRSPRGSLS